VLSFSTVEAGFGDFLKKVSSGLDEATTKIDKFSNTVSEYAGNAEKTITIATVSLLFIYRHLKNLKIEPR
jgi:hypothetical protein